MSKNVIIIAGPCAVESREQILRIAHKLKSIGVEYLRGGAFKPRTNPNSFQGLGDEGIKYLLEAREQTGLKIVTELMTIDQVKKYGNIVDVIQIGTRNMYNYELLKEVGKLRTPVLLKRGLSATYNEWINASEYIKMGGNNNIILCERGVRSFEKETRNMLDIQAIPYIKENTDYPIFVDPSHACGNKYMVKPNSLASVAAGCDGLIIEVHDEAENALSDGEQSISIETMKEIIDGVKKLENI